MIQSENREQTCKVSSLPPRNNDKDPTINLYEEVVNKNFQIFKNILPRIHSLYQFNEELQKNVSALQSRFSKMESDSENLHYEMRTNHLAIDSKLNNILAEYNNISTETIKIRKQTELLSREIKENKVRQNSDRNFKYDDDQCEQDTKMPKKQRSRKIMFMDEAEGYDDKNQETRKNRSFLHQRKRRSSIMLEQDDHIQTAKVQFKLLEHNNYSQKLVDHRIQRQQNRGMKSDREICRKTNLKHSTNSIKNMATAKDLGAVAAQKINKDRRSSNAELQRFQVFLKEIETYHMHNQKIKKNYQELMAEYCKTQQAQFSSIQGQISTLLLKVTDLQQHRISIDTIKLDIQNKIGDLSKHVDKCFSAQQLKIDQKINRVEFTEMIIQLNKRISGVYQERKKLANKQQTKKAVQFLQKKINNILDQYHQSKQQSIHTVEIDRNGCFRNNYSKSINQQNRQFQNVPQVNISQNCENNVNYTPEESLSTTKRQAGSLHSKHLHSTFVDHHRFNEQLTYWKSCTTQKVERTEQVTTCRTRGAKSKQNIILLKKKSTDILGNSKIKIKTKLKKQRLIFQYD